MQSRRKEFSVVWFNLLSEMYIYMKFTALGTETYETTTLLWDLGHFNLLGPFSLRCNYYTVKNIGT